MSRTALKVVSFAVINAQVAISPVMQASAQQYDAQWETQRRLEQQWQEHDAEMRRHAEEDLEPVASVQEPDPTIERALEITFDCVFLNRNCEKATEPLN